MMKTPTNLGIHTHLNPDIFYSELQQLQKKQRRLRKQLMHREAQLERYYTECFFKKNARRDWMIFVVSSIGLTFLMSCFIYQYYLTGLSTHY